MKKLICALLAAVMVLSLAACGGTPQETAPETTLPPATTLPPETTEPPLTAKTVVEQMVQAVEEKTMTGGTVTMAFNFTMIAPGAEGKEDTEITMEMGMEMDMKLSVEPLAMYTDNKVSVKMTGMDTTIETETYLVQEEGQMVTYSHMLMNDSWTKNPMPESQMQDINKKADYSWILTKDDGELTLADEHITAPRAVHFATGCFLLIRTAAFRQLEGFDPRFFLYQEDTDLSRRAEALGRIIYHPDMVVTNAWARENTRTLRGNLRQVSSIFKYFHKWGWKW